MPSEVSTRQPRSCHGWTQHHVVVFLLTFFTYALFHASRKTFSNVKDSISRVWTPENLTQSPFFEYDQWNAHHLFPDMESAEVFLGILDTSFLGAYAIGLFISGVLGDRYDPRLVLTYGMIISAFFLFLFGFLTEVLHFYNKAFYVTTFLLCGFAQSCGWPNVVCVMGNWFGRGSRGVVLGLWSACASVGNIIGAYLAAYFGQFGYHYTFLACEAPVAKFWASANKGVATYYKIQEKSDAMKQEAQAAKTALVDWKKEVISSMKVKCILVGKSAASASFSAKNKGLPTYQGVDLGAAFLAQIAQNNYWLTTKNKGLDYSHFRTLDIMENSIGLFDKAGANLSVSQSVTDAVLSVGTAISTTVNANPSEAPRLYKSSFTFNPNPKFPNFARNAAVTFYKLMLNNPNGAPTSYNKTAYTEQTKEAKNTVWIMKWSWRHGFAADSIVKFDSGEAWSNAWAADIWSAITDCTLVVKGVKYVELLYLAETQSSLLNCFTGLLNVTATASPSYSEISYNSPFQRFQRIELDVITRCFNLGFFVTTVPPFG